MEAEYVLSFGEIYFDYDDECSDIIFTASSEDEKRHKIRNIICDFCYGVFKIDVSYNSMICTLGKLHNIEDDVVDSLISKNYWCCKNRNSEYRCPISCFTINHANFLIRKDGCSRLTDWNPIERIMWKKNKEYINVDDD